MTTNSETDAVKEYLLSNPKNLAVALAVYESWPTVRDHICKQFLERLCDRIKHEIARNPTLFGNDIHVGCKYEGEKKWSNRLWVHRLSWHQYKRGRDDSKKRTSIRLESTGPGPNGWFYGVSYAERTTKNESDDSDRERQQDLEKELREKKVPGINTTNNMWPVLKNANERMRDWNSLLPELLGECGGGGNEITNYYVDAFLDVAKTAVPIIDRLEGSKK